MAELKEAGCVCVTDDGRPVMSAGVMRRALEYARDLDLPVMVHAEDLTVSSGGAMNAGPVATGLGLSGVPAAAEVAMVQRDLLLAETCGARLHVAHVSAAGSVRAIREAKARGVRMTAEATPHHFTLTDEAVAGMAASGDQPAADPYDTHAKMSPPLRAESDRAAVVAALNDGTIEAIATDHAPHGALDKQVEFIHAANGIIGLETSLALTLALVRSGELPLPRAVERLTVGPARCFGLPYGTLGAGASADVAVIDAEREWKVDPQRFYSRSRNSPFAGWTLRGKVVKTCVAGQQGIIDSSGASAKALIERARKAPGMEGQDLATRVSTKAPYRWEQGVAGREPQARKHEVVVVDYGVKRGILRQLVDIGCGVTVVPSRTPASEILARKPDGVVLSNGPGDPAAVVGADVQARELLGKVPVMGICLGNQILALAMGGKSTSWCVRGRNTSRRPAARCTPTTAAMSSGCRLSSTGSSSTAARRTARPPSSASCARRAPICPARTRTC